jgi:hypothetical protein
MGGHDEWEGPERSVEEHHPELAAERALEQVLEMGNEFDVGRERDVLDV